jgi:threonine/homoserine efflux transporter RhtA
MFILSFKKAKDQAHKQHSLCRLRSFFPFAAVDAEFMADRVTLIQISLPVLFLSAILPYSSVSDPTVLQPVAGFTIPT